MGFKKILVAIIQSPLASVVFEQALELAPKASLMLFHCINSDNLSQHLPDWGQVEAGKLRSMVATLLPEPKTRYSPGDTFCEVRQPGASIVALPKTWGAI